ncbi:MAG: hypothetical protein CRN43_02075 [Candidatus Nephrothrix sp. EaCA]|nr:MAG: hypothetical protein CRN43_02075 [Candidatus Nephrothrix sp. EaCA]
MRIAAFKKQGKSAFPHLFGLIYILFFFRRRLFPSHPPYFHESKDFYAKALFTPPLMPAFI